MTAKFDWTTIAATFGLGGYEVSAELSDSSALLALIALTQMQHDYVWQNYSDFDDVETAIDLAIAEIMTGIGPVSADTKIAEAVAITDCAYLEIDDFETGDYQSFELWLTGLQTDENGAWIDHVDVQINEDTTAANYFSMCVFEDVDTYLRYEHIGNFAGIRLYWTAATKQTADASIGHAKLRLYAPQSDDWKTLEWNGTMNYMTAGNMVKTKGTGVWGSTSPITSIKILPGTGSNFTIDPGESDEPSELRMTLYGLG